MYKSKCEQAKNAHSFFMGFPFMFTAVASAELLQVVCQKRSDIVSYVVICRSATTAGAATLWRFHTISPRSPDPFRSRRKTLVRLIKLIAVSSSGWSGTGSLRDAVGATFSRCRRLCVCRRKLRCRPGTPNDHLKAGCKSPPGAFNICIFKDRLIFLPPLPGAVVL